MTDHRMIDDPEYVQGQIDSLRSLILGLAQQISKADFREQSLERLEILKTSFLPLPTVSEARLKAVEDCVAWVKRVTE